MPISVKLPDGRTIKVNADDPQKAAKAARLYLAREKLSKTRPQNTFQTEVGRTATFGLQDPVNAGFAALTDVPARLMGKNPGYSMGEAFTAARGIERERSDEYNKKNPVRGFAGGILGSLAAPGGAQMASFIGKAPGLLQQTLRAGLVGLGTGGVYGAATSEPGKELEGAKRGAIVGGITAGAMPGAGRVAGAVANSAPVKATVRAANRASGGRLLDATSEASKRLIEALRKDGADDATVKAVMNQWLKTGASSPAVIDVASKLPSGGQNTIGLLRGAAMKAGPGRGEVSNYRQQVEGDLQPNVIARTRKLTPETRSAPQMTEDLTNVRGELASTQYAEPYAQVVVPDDATLAALSGAPGKAALQRARSAAEARMDTQQLAEIDALLAGENVPVGAGTLDRVKIAMRERADKAARSGAGGLSSGLSRRTSMIDDSLESVPGLQDARATYGNLTNQVKAIPEGAGVMNAAPDEFAATLEARIAQARATGQITEEQAQEAIRAAARVGGARELETTLGRPTENATGAINRIGSSTNTGRNLQSLYGAEEAGAYQEALRNEALRLQNARSIDPTQNSRTALNLEDAGGQALQKPSIGNIVAGLIDKIRRGATLTDEERQVLIKLGTSQASPNLIPQQPPRAQISPAFALPAALAIQ